MKNILIIISLALTSIVVYAQDDLMKELEAIPQPVTPVTATFKGTQLINLNTIETLKKRSLDFRISHRFGDVSSGSKNLWGLDGPATLRLSLAYSPTNRLMIGVSRTTYKKMYEASAKYKLIQQIPHDMPVSITAFVSANATSEDDATKQITGVDRYQYFSSRMSYVMELMIARKFNSNLSLQLTPIFIHYNLVMQTTDKNDMMALAASGRYKLTKSLALTAEYVYRLNKYSADFNTYKDIVGVGFDIETGGHVFQLFFTNGSAINEAQMIPYTTSNIEKKQFRFGFNISRVFEFKKKSR